MIHDFEPIYKLSEGTQLQDVPTSHEQNAVLFETVTPVYVQGNSRQAVNFDSKNLSNTLYDRSACVITYKYFPSVFNSLNEDEKRTSIIHRAYWLGESFGCKGKVDIQKLSNFLCETFAERIRRWEANVNTAHLIPYSPFISRNSPLTYEVGESYQTWFSEIRGEAKYDIPLIKAFLNKEKLSGIEDTAFGHTTPVLTDEEIAKIYSLLNQTMEPTLEAKAKDWRQKAQEQSSSDIAKLTNSISELVGAFSAQTQTTNKKTEK